MTEKDILRNEIEKGNRQVISRVKRTADSVDELTEEQAKRLVRVCHVKPYTQEQLDYMKFKGIVQAIAEIKKDFSDDFDGDFFALSVNMLDGNAGQKDNACSELIANKYSEITKPMAENALSWAKLTRDIETESAAWSVLHPEQSMEKAKESVSFEERCKKAYKECKKNLEKNEKKQERNLDDLQR